MLEQAAAIEPRQAEVEDDRIEGSVASAATPAAPSRSHSTAKPLPRSPACSASPSSKIVLDEEHAHGSVVILVFVQPGTFTEVRVLAVLAPPPHLRRRRATIRRRSSRPRSRSRARPLPAPSRVPIAGRWRCELTARSRLVACGVRHGRAATRVRRPVIIVATRFRRWATLETTTPTTCTATMRQPRVREHLVEFLEGFAADFIVVEPARQRGRRGEREQSVDGPAAGRVVALVVPCATPDEVAKVGLRLRQDRRRSHGSARAWNPRNPTAAGRPAGRPPCSRTSRERFREPSSSARR